MSSQNDKQEAQRVVAPPLEEDRHEYPAEQQWSPGAAQGREMRIRECVSAAAAAVAERDAVLVRTEAIMGDAVRELVDLHSVPLREAAKQCQISIKDASRLRRESLARFFPGAALGSHGLPVALERFSVQENRESLDYKAALKLTREDAITLGVPGSSPEANAQRALLAQDIVDQWTERSNSAYRAAVWPSEPNVLEPFGVRKVAAAGGDVRSVVEGPDFEDDVLRDMGHGAHTQFINDEDGQRYIFVEPTRDDLLEAAREATRIRAVLAARGVLSAPSEVSVVLPAGQRSGQPSRAIREARHRQHTFTDRPGPSHSPF